MLVQINNRTVIYSNFLLIHCINVIKVPYFSSDKTFKLLALLWTPAVKFTYVQIGNTHISAQLPKVVLSFS